MLDQGSTQGNQIIRVDPEQPVKIFRVSRNCFFLQGVINLLDIARHCLRFAHGCWLRPHRGQGEVGAEGGEAGRFHLDSVSRLLQAAKVHCLQCNMQAFKPSTHMLCRRPG